MKKINILLFLQLSLSLVLGQKKADFPDAWIGKWKGQMEIITGKGVAQTIPMETHIAKGDSADTWKWTLIYAAKKDSPDVRPYVIKLKDKSKGHYIMDEKNTILLDSYYIGGEFWSEFEVQGTHLVTVYRMEGKNLISTIMYGPSEAIQTTGGGSEDTPPVKSYAVKGVQRCVMKRSK